MKGKIKLLKYNLVQNAPVYSVSLLLMLTFWFSIRSLTNYVLLLVGQFIEYIPMFVLFGNPLKPSLIGLILFSVLAIGSWLLSTKLDKFKSMEWRVFIFFQMFIGIVTYYTWYVSAPVYNHIVPFFLERVSKLDIQSVWHYVLVGNPEGLMSLFVFVPGIIVTLLLIWTGGQYTKHNKLIAEAFEDFEFRSSFIQHLFNLNEEVTWPDIVLGPDSENQELVTQPGRDRTLNNLIIGSIGTGKTAALALPILNQDLHWMARFVNVFPKVFYRDDYKTKDVGGMYLNGISVIEPSNDLCQNTFDLVRAHNIPEEAVFYIDPTNPDTPSINPMQGPVDQVAEAFAMVIEGLAEGGGGGNNFFFQQSERNHLKHYIYLLKLHDPNKSVTFDMLLDMYNNDQLVRHMHVALKSTIPEDIDSIQDRDIRNHWKIAQQIDEWFDRSLLPKTGRSGATELVRSGEYRGEEAYFDARAEYVQGLRNILNDIGANPLIRRVLFGDSDFDFDRHLEFGGILLVNTAKGELSGLSNVLGKLVLLSLQNAVFRRQPEVSNFHHILVDEFPDYIYRPFREFPAQSRKYKVIVTVIAQTITQLADKYGETYMHTLLGTLRHKMVYGDVTEFDARVFSAIFGEETRFDEMQSEQSVSPLQENPMMRTGHSYTESYQPIFSPNDIIYQKEFQAAVKIVQDNRPMPARQIDANFVPYEEFETAKITVDDESVSTWLEERRRLVTDSSDILTRPIDEVRDADDIVADTDEFDSEHSETVKPIVDNSKMVEKPLPSTNENVEISVDELSTQKPEGEVEYNRVPADKLNAKVHQQSASETDTKSDKKVVTKTLDESVTDNEEVIHRNGQSEDKEAVADTKSDDESFDPLSAMFNETNVPKITIEEHTRVSDPRANHNVKREQVSVSKLESEQEFLMSNVFRRFGNHEDGNRSKQINRMRTHDTEIMSSIFDDRD